MKLINLKLRNFKGIKEFELSPNGESISLFGDNGTGKTTLFDAFSWLLFDKDSANRKDFEIKTLGTDGQAVHGLEHEVEGKLDIAGQTLILKKVYSENWTKKRGSAEKEFTGHSTNYFIDGVPVKKNEYEAKIAKIIDEDAFKLLTNPRHFNEVLHWQERRKLLLEVCGDLTDAEVIAADSKLAKLPMILDGRRLEDHRKVITARRSTINKEIEAIPIRISEAERALPSIQDDSSTATELETLRQRRNIKAQDLATLEAGGAIAEKTKELSLIQTNIEKAERERWTENANRLQSEKSKLRDLEGQANQIEAQIASRNIVVKEKQGMIIAHEANIDELREKWHKVNDATFTCPQSDACPTCGQSLPAEQVEAACDAALAAFNTAKATELKTITEQGHELKTKVDALKLEIGELELTLNADQESLDSLNKLKATSKETIDAMEKEDKPAIPEYVELLQRKTEIEKEILQLNFNNSEAVEALKSDISTIDEQIAACEQTIARGKQREAGLKRIDELKAEERNLAKEFEKLEGELFLTDEFVRTKVKLLEERINSQFMMARFKLFNELVNGGIEEVCETLYLGVPYSSALNNSARINIGLDIINTLSDHFQFVAPIWIDNAEAVTELVQTKGQQIRLYVSESDKILRVEQAYLTIPVYEE